MLRESKGRTTFGPVGVALLLIVIGAAMAAFSAPDDETVRLGLPAQEAGYAAVGLGLVVLVVNGWRRRNGGGS